MLSKKKPKIVADNEDIASNLIALIQQLAVEFNIPPVRWQNLNLDTAFDSELGLDSLTRVELISRIERSFAVRLPEQALVGVETPRELLREILASSPRYKSGKNKEIRYIERGEVQANPDHAETLVDVLRWHALVHPDRPHVKLFSEEAETEEIISYGELWAGAEGTAIGLQQRGLAAKQAVTIMLPTGKDYLFSFYGILMAGGIPVPIYPPARLNQVEDHLMRHQRILNNCRAVIMITVAEAKPVARLLKAQVETLQTMVTASELISGGASLLQPKLHADDIAFLQYTSGSTGTPKGVVLTHANLLTNIRRMGERVNIGASDVFVSWLPLYHDMGLIGAWLGSLYFSALLVIMSPLMFLARPSRWLWAIHGNRGTMTAAPNFAYELCAKKVEDEALEGLDLSCLKTMFNGAEPIKPSTLNQFTSRFRKYGFPPQALLPVYGLAECALGLAFPRVGRGPVVDQIKRGVFTSTGRAVQASSETGSLSFVCCGSPLREHEIRVVDSSGRELPERQEGHLQFRGPSVTGGYYRNPDDTRQLFSEGWANSGDLAYIAGGEVYLTGRVKDVIIHGGRNIYPHELEDAVSNIEGIRTGCVAVFGASDADSVTERLVVLAETRETEADARERLRLKVNEVSAELIGSAPEEVVLAPPYTVLKTSSGKIRRAACREIYLHGLIGKGPKAVWRQILSLLAVSLTPQIKAFRGQASACAFALYAWIVLVVSSFIGWVGVVFIPNENFRWLIMHRMPQFIVSALRIPVIVHGEENLLPEHQPCIFVCNHLSYVDHLIVLIGIPGKISFVAKAELEGQFVAGNFLKRVGGLFVERFNRKKGIEDAKRLSEAAKAGRSLLFYPEGTFTRMPGLLPFQLGAFLTAAESRLPIVPITIRGTRSVLRSDSLFPRYHAPISLTISEAIYPERIAADSSANPWEIAVKLRDLARNSILKNTGEPDLGVEKSPLR